MAPDVFYYADFLLVLFTGSRVIFFRSLQSLTGAEGPDIGKTVEPIQPSCRLIGTRDLVMDDVIFRKQLSEATPEAEKNDDAGFRSSFLRRTGPRRIFKQLFA